MITARRFRAGLGALAVIVALLAVAFFPLLRMASAEERPAPVPQDDAAHRPPENLLTQESLQEGKRTYQVHCTSCHGQDASGGIGPQLTDQETIHGGRFVDIVTVITNGVEQKGMPKWIGKLGPEQVYRVAAYVYTLKGTKPPGKKGAIRFSVIWLAPGAGLLKPEMERH